MLRRIAVLLLVLSSLPGSALAALCVDAPQAVALTDDLGRELVSGPDIEDVFAVRPNALYAAGLRGAYRLYDGSGRQLGNIIFEMIDDSSDALVFRRGGLYGAMDAAGALLIAPVWTQLTSDGAGGWLALDGDPLSEQPNALLHLDASGAAQATNVRLLGGLSEVSCGRMPFMASGGLWGATNAEGSVAIEPVWVFLGPFRDGYARAWSTRGAGLVDVDGRVAIEPVYDWLEQGPGYVAALNEKGLTVFSQDGSRRLFTVPGAGLEVGLAGSRLWVSDGKGVRLFDANGTVLDSGAPGTTYSAGSLGQTIACDGEWGEKCQRLLGSDGAVASARLQQILPVCDGRYAWLEMDGIEYYSTELDRVQRSWDYSNLRYGLMDASGKPLTAAIYREIRPLSANRMLMLTDDAAILADMNGRALRTWHSAEGTEASAEAAG